MIDPGTPYHNPVVPTVRIQGLAVGAVEHAPADGPQFAPGTRDIRIRYAASSLAFPERLRFRYRLEGFDDAWQDAGNRRESLRETLLDLEQGADIVMVKPAMSYLDIVADVRAAVDVPVAAYQVSGEYAMIEAAAANGWIDRERAIDEALLSIRRAGSDIILTYWATEVARRLTR